MQEGDVLLCQTVDGGEINVEGGLVEMSGGLPSAAYLSLFGGNEDDGGGDDVSKTWWANLDEEDNDRQYRSETQNLLQSLPATSGNLLRIEDAVKRDLQWMIDVGAASTIEASASVPGLNRIRIIIDINAHGLESSFEFVENWKVRS